ncbi:MAG: hydrogenase maturation nickel metallochaperone HypA [Actinomycetota bacterium]
MHEYHVVHQLVDQIVAEAARQGLDRIAEVRLRTGSTFTVESVNQAFEILAKGTILEGATLVNEEFSQEHTCLSCGRSAVISHDDLIGHMFVCAGCGAVEEIDEARGLQVIGVTGEGTGAEPDGIR